MKTEKKDPYRIKRSKFFDSHELQQIMDVSEFNSLQDEEKGHSIWIHRWMLIHLSFYSGLRVSEIAALKIRDLYFGSTPYLYVGRGKGSKSREVYIDSHLANHLQDYIKGRHPLEPLFSNQGRHYSTTGLHKSFKQAVRHAHLREDLTIHSARHTFATLSCSKTGNLRFVQKQLGHSTIAMTCLYADLLPEHNTRFAEMILN